MDANWSDMPLLQTAGWAKRTAKARIRLSEGGPTQTVYQPLHASAESWAGMAAAFDSHVGSQVAEDGTTVERVDFGPDVVMWGPLPCQGMYYSIFVDTRLVPDVFGDQEVTFRILACDELGQDWMADTIATLALRGYIRHSLATRMPCVGLTNAQNFLSKFSHVTPVLYTFLESVGFQSQAGAKFLRALVYGTGDPTGVVDTKPLTPKPPSLFNFPAPRSIAPARAGTSGAPSPALRVGRSRSASKQRRGCSPKPADPDSPPQGHLLKTVGSAVSQQAIPYPKGFAQLPQDAQDKLIEGLGLRFETKPSSQLRPPAGP